jgi:fused signal recognition particle receptor
MNFQTTTSSFLEYMTEVSKQFGSGNTVADIVVVLLLLSLLALAMGLIALFRSPKRETGKGAFERYDNIGGRVERLEMHVNESKTEVSRSLEIFRGEVGYIKQELAEVKAILRRANIAGVEDADGYIDPTQTPLTAVIPVPAVTQPEEVPEQHIEVTEPEPFQPEPITALPVVTPESLSKRLTKSRRGLFDKIRSLFLSKPQIGEDTLAELEALLVGSDLGVKTSQSLLAELKAEVASGTAVDEERLLALLKMKVLTILEKNGNQDQPIVPRKRGADPLVVLVVGVNGVGKTTTAAKLASMWKAQGARVLLVAADTFRAAAVDQLVEWGKRIDVPVVSGAPNAKPQTVVFEGMQKAKELEMDVVLIDTAGRLHTKTNLMQELESVAGTVGKHIASAPHESILVVDGATGQNALQQAREFNAAAKLTGLIVTKLDGTPKGGIVVAIKEELGLPVRYIGVGEGPEDLRPFVARDFVEALFDNTADGESSVHSDGGESAHAETRRRKRRDTQPYL